MLEDNDLVSKIDSDNRDKNWFNETDKAFSGKVTLKVNCDLICHRESHFLRCDVRSQFEKSRPNQGR